MKNRQRNRKRTRKRKSNCQDRDKRKTETEQFWQQITDYMESWTFREKERIKLTINKQIENKKITEENRTKKAK